MLIVKSSKKFNIFAFSLLSLIIIATIGVLLHSREQTSLAVGSYDNASIADIALSKKGSYGGTCKTFVNNIVNQVSGGTQWPAPGYHSGFLKAGGVPVSSSAAQKGDIIQVGNNDNDDPLHTAIIVKNNGGNKFTVVDSNWNEDGIVREHDNFDPYTFANGNDVRIWRMGTAIGQWNGVGNATLKNGNTLTNGQQLLGNEYLVSEDGRFVLMMQTDGNLVIYGPGRKSYWSSNTSGNPGAYLGIQSDGNIVIYRNGIALWATNTTSARTLSIQTDGNLVARNSTNGVAWATNTAQSNSNNTYKGDSKLSSGQTLTANQYIKSSNKKYYALMQADGNLVLYKPGYIVYWASNTSGSSSAYLGVQSDGNIVIYRSGVARWATNTTSARTLSIQTDGNLVARNLSNGAVWASNTTY